MIGSRSSLPRRVLVCGLGYFNRLLWLLESAQAERQIALTFIFAALRIVWALTVGTLANARTQKGEFVPVFFPAFKNRHALPSLFGAFFQAPTPFDLS